ncbi:hypothetical protein WN48_03574 [Eufriesea mexicana]|uniref:uncharacterized protein LOC108549577 isoform X1 n=1 Tax=Eufriesea mexicana TaxID=516756 RepID=UPI00083BDF54|nr:PREDICTED: uncharacterized protein LOC108549577 isoform X1 [Eufriesea mexicana]XP_017758521.1 PREDICTED: uncharacterized protein LOC108549577 isoform X1 [Eufriesea mexicana]XP_017758522.1 PREDICTED: uncharacterized protein LOC108549577 isoform X1 [Eufriesea mexicana]XP_017758523.1 PREDICTED: uncharacterized protein LOC108549577 isoform X1 [Eufriesea mexicana]XP_017758524.1 PREDICTED: uncharacterized protein LOC108549577 isoform X1 [Eufriesea mexicana]OAD56256.1 hypothetical protein WN48_035
MKNKSEFFVLVKMFRKSLFCIVILTNFTLFCKSKAIQNQDIRSNIINNAGRAQDEYINGRIDSEAPESESLSGKGTTHDTCVGNCNGENPKFLSHDKQPCPYENKGLCLIFSLSKIANVQVATLGEALTHTLKSNIFDNTSKDAKNSRIDEKLREEEHLHLGSGNRNGNRYSENFSGNRMRSSNVHCRAVRDVYIAEVKRHLPAFACKFGNRTVVLSSERFLQDRRLYLDIRVDEDTFTNIKLAPKIARSNEFNVIPALLILNVANNDYRIEMRKSIPNEGKVNQAEGNR